MKPYIDYLEIATKLMIGMTFIVFVMAVIGIVAIALTVRENRTTEDKL